MLKQATLFKAPSPVAHKSRIMIVDDQEANVRLLEGILKRGGYPNVAGTTESREAISLYESWFTLRIWFSACSSVTPSS